jgi:hypothetical protein
VSDPENHTIHLNADSHFYAEMRVNDIDVVDWFDPLTVTAGKYEVYKPSVTTPEWWTNVYVFAVAATFATLRANFTAGQVDTLGTYRIRAWVVCNNDGVWIPSRFGTIQVVQ